MSATYKIRARIGEQGEPLLLMTVAAEWELLIDRGTLKHLRDATMSVMDRSHAEPEEVDAWDFVIDDIEDIHGRVAETIRHTIGMETTPQPMPMDKLHEILTEYAGRIPPTLNFSISGAPPTLQLNVHVGIMSAKFPMSLAEAQTAKSQLDVVAVECGNAVQDGRDWAGLYDALKADARLTSAAVKCSVALGAAAAARGPVAKVLGAGKAAKICKDSVETIIEIMREYEAKAKAARDAAQRQRDKEMNDRIGQCKPDQRIDGDMLERINRTA
jgi:hypothetical protein